MLSGEVMLQGGSDVERRKFCYEEKVLLHGEVMLISTQPTAPV